MTRSLDPKEVAAEVEKWLGREPSDEEILAEIQSRNDGAEAAFLAAAENGEFGPTFQKFMIEKRGEHGRR